MENAEARAASPRELMLAQTNESLKAQRNSAQDALAQHEARSVLQAEAIKAYEKLVAELNRRIADLEAAAALSTPEITN